MRFVSMLRFHLALFARNSFFVQLMLTSTLSVLALQAIAALASDSPADGTAWLRAGMVGMWSVSTVAAGLIGYQRFQGTLVHLAMSPRSLASTLTPLIASAASFGLLALPTAAAAAWVLRLPFAPISAVGLLVGGTLLWASCLVISFVVAALFVLTPNAITYEGLLLVPLVLLSGIFGIPESIRAWVAPLSYLVPTTHAVAALLGAGTVDAAFWTRAGLGLLVSAGWLGGAVWLIRRVAKKATRDGTLELI
ncbi:ABC transporter permease [Micrococcales bacterium 31B]|nr:ABC transporter permease [Micrococcales bacterium 31B]